MILVTGATGFVGQRVIAQLAMHYNPREILCLNWKYYRTNKNREIETRGRKLISDLGIQARDVDMVTGEGMNNLPKHVSLVINIAANTDTSSSDHRCNDVGVANLIKYVGRSLKGCHFLQISTIAFMAGRTITNRGIRLSDSPCPTNEYGRSKLRGEELLLTACKKFGFSLTILRLNTVYGPGSRPDSMFELLIKWSKAGSLPSRINWPGLTSLVHVNDVAAVVLNLLKKVPKKGICKTYIVYGESLKLCEICEIVYRGVNKKYQRINVPGIVWKSLSALRRWIPVLEPVLPSGVYNQVWRLGLIVDDVVYCEAKELSKRLPRWKPLKLAQIPIDSIL